MHVLLERGDRPRGRNRKILSKRNETGITCNEAIGEMARILHTIVTPPRTSLLSWRWAAYRGQYKWALVPDATVKEADRVAKESLAGGAASAAGGEAMIDTE